MVGTSNFTIIVLDILLSPLTTGARSISSGRRITRHSINSKYYVGEKVLVGCFYALTVLKNLRVRPQLPYRTPGPLEQLKAPRFQRRQATRPLVRIERSPSRGAAELPKRRCSAIKWLENHEQRRSLRTPRQKGSLLE